MEKYVDIWEENYRKVRGALEWISHAQLADVGEQNGGSGGQGEEKEGNEEMNDEEPNYGDEHPDGGKEGIGEDGEVRRRTTRKGQRGGSTPEVSQVKPEW